MRKFISGLLLVAGLSAHSRFQPAHIAIPKKESLHSINLLAEQPIRTNIMSVASRLVGVSMNPIIWTEPR